MADNHYEIGNSLRGRELRTALKQIRTSWYEVKQAFDSMTQMLTGPSTDPASFDNVVAYFDISGVAGADAQADKRADAKALYDELNSTLGNSAALLQLLSRTG